MILPIHVLEGTAPEASVRPQGLVLREPIPPYPVGSSSSQQAGTERARFDINTVQGQLCEVSISHDWNLATAVAIVPSY